MGRFNEWLLNGSFGRDLLLAFLVVVGGTAATLIACALMADYL